MTPGTATHSIGPIALALAALLTGAREDLSYKPEVGAQSTKTFLQQFEVRLVASEQVFTVDGERRADPEPDGSGLVLKESETLTITDEYLAVEGGRATNLRRTFDELSTQSFLDVGVLESEGAPEPERGQSPLMGQTVRFDWDPTAEAYDAAFVGDGAPEPSGATPSPALLEGLEADADLTWFLPGRPVAIGESWQLEPTAFTRLAAPVGDHKIERPGDERAEDAFEARFDANLRGDVRCTLRDTADGIARIAIAMTLDTTVDESATDGGLSRESSTYTFHFELAGELGWNVDRGCAVGLQLAGPATLKLANEQSGVLGGVGFQLHSVQDFAGTLKFDVEVR